MELVFLFLAGAIAIYVLMRKSEMNPHRQRWRDSHIHAYRMTLRYDRRSLNFDGEILGDGTTITVIDGAITEVSGQHVGTSSIEEYERFTVEGLFEQVVYYDTVQYDAAYGFPSRLGDTRHWVIEVIAFEILE